MKRPREVACQLDMISHSKVLVFFRCCRQLDESTRFILSSFMSPLELLPGQVLHNVLGMVLPAGAQA